MANAVNLNGLDVVDRAAVRVRIAAALHIPTVGVAQRLEERLEVVVVCFGEETLPIPLEGGVGRRCCGQREGGQPGYFAGEIIRGDADDAPGPDRHEGERQGIVAGEN